jgi:hypothetical protein
MRTFPKLFAALSLIIALSCSFAAAGPLNLTQNDPDAYSLGITITYTASTGLFTATGKLDYITTTPTSDPNYNDDFGEVVPYTNGPGGPLNNANGPFSFSLTATIANSVAQNTPVSLTNGSLTISGQYSGEADGFGTSSDLVETFFSSSQPMKFAYSDPSNNASPLFDFIFAGQGGTEWTAGQNIGLEIDAAGTMATFYPNFFTQNFSNTGTAAVVDTFNVPEPGALSLMGVAAIGLLRRKRA